MTSNKIKSVGRFVAVLLLAVIACTTVSAQDRRMPVKRGHTAVTTVDLDSAEVIVADSILTASTDSALAVIPVVSGYDVWEPREVEFNPDPTRAVWMSALFPGLGQVYNRRYWKLPLVVGGFMGLGYATSWNNGMLSDYTRAYRDIMDNDPSTKSYMDFFPPTVNESDLDKKWLTNLLQSRKNFYRRNRDLCIICMVGVYFLAMIDAYVDASLSHFDISPDLSMDIAPALMRDGRNPHPSIGLVWAFNF
ncbi:MAG: DUF5683 domain-containing protein [Bacteroidales bacterium]|nr:DUF5683 domain-containing protein [Bacteroidales bacterium]